MPLFSRYSRARRWNGDSLQRLTSEVAISQSVSLIAIIANEHIGSIVPGDARSDSEQPMSAQASGKKAIRPNQTLKLKKQVPKYSKPGNWREGSTIDRTPPTPIPGFSLLVRT